MGLRSPGRGVLPDLAKLVVFCGVAVLIIPATTNVGSLADLPAWWSTPIAIQKFAVWTLLWEVAGLGAGFGRPGRGALFWIQPGTNRQPPWPTRIPSTAGGTREFVDAAVYLAVLLVPIGLLTAGTAHGHPFDTLPPSGVCALLGCLALLGLRDRTAFLAASPEFLVPVVLAFAFEPGNLLFAVKLALAGSCCAALTGWLRGSRARYPWALAGYALVLGLLFARGGAVSWLAVAFALAALAYAAVASRAFELCAFLGFATVYVFGHYAAAGAATLTSPTLIVLLTGVLLVVLLSAAVRPVRRPVTLRPMPGPRPSPRPRPTPEMRPQPRAVPRPRPTPRPSPGIIGT